MEIPVSPLVQLGILIAALATIRPFLGKYIFEIVQGQRSFFILEKFENFLLSRDLGEEKHTDQSFQQYLKSFLIFHVILVGLLLIFQWILSRASMSFDLMINNAISLMTNTNWQSVPPEIFYSNTFQMVGVTLAHFLSPAVGIVVFLALTRAFSKKRKESSHANGPTANTNGINGSFGNFYLEMLRITIGVLLPLALVCTLILIALGIPQHFQGDVVLTGIDGAKSTIPGGAIASQTAIKLLGTNGGGYFMANAAHPFENPGEWSHMLQMLMMLILAAALTDTFGRLVGDPRQGKAFFTLMIVMLIASVFIGLIAESDNVDVWSGIESRFGESSSLLYNMISANSGTGATESALEEFSPLTVMVLLISMMLSIIFGPAGTGLIQMILYSLFAIFLAGLIIGRTPEFLGKKIGAFDIKCLGAGLFIPPFVIIACVMASVVSLPFKQSPHTITELAYTFTSTAHNNGSSYGLLDFQSKPMLWLTSIAMLLGRMSVLLSGLFLAKSLLAKQKIPRNRGTFPTNTPLFTTFVAVSAVVSLLLVIIPTFVIGPFMDYLNAS